MYTFGSGMPRKMHAAGPGSQANQQGKYFYIKSNLSGLVIEPEGGQVYPGVRLVTLGQKQGSSADSQLFYKDSATGTVRSKLNDYCVDTMSDSIVLNPYQPGNGSQEWNVSGQFITNRKNPALALDIQGSGSVPGSRVVMWNYEGKRSQQWTIEYQKAQYFQIVSEMNGKVLDVNGSNKAAGTPVVMWGKPSGDQKLDNQLWYEDQTGVIRSKLNNFALDASAPFRIVMNPYAANNTRQQWIFQGNKVVNRHNTNEVLDIAKDDMNDGAELCAFRYKASTNQHWMAAYI